MSAVLKVGRGAESIEPTDVGIERITIAEVVISNEKLILLVDGPVPAEIRPLGILHLGGSGEVGWADPKPLESGLSGGGGRVRGGVGALEMLVCDEEEHLIFHNRSADIADEVVDMQAGFYNTAGHIGIAVVEDGARTCRLGAPDVLSQTVKLIRAGVGDAVVDDPGGVAKLRGEAVGHRVDLFDIRVRDGEETKAITIAL